MTRRKQPFTDTAQLDDLNQEVWNTLEEGQESTKKRKPEAGDDTGAAAPGAVTGDSAESPPTMG